MPVQIQVEDMPDEHTRRLMDQGLDEFNFGKVGVTDDTKDLWIIARGEDDSVQGGANAKTYYSWMFVDWLWVSPHARGGGIGSLLIDQAEATARQCGCIGAYVDTFSFQAPGFYKRCGYEEFGRIENLLPGHACIWLRKSFA